jgi:zinc protease
MLTRIAVTLALGASFAAAQQIPSRPEQLTFGTLNFQTPKVKDFKNKLKNGIPVYMAPDPGGVPLVRLSVMWRGGAYLDPAGKEGLAAMYGSQLSHGGTAKLTPEKVEERLEDLAASLSSSCGDVSGTLTLQALEKDFDEVLGMFMDVLTAPAFSQDRFDLAKRTQKQGLDRRNDAVTSIAQYQMRYLLYGENHFAALDPTAASLDAITRDDLRAFHARLMHPGNFVVSISGRFDRKAILDKLNRTLGALQPAKEAALSPRIPVPDFARKPGIYVSDKEAPQAMVQWAFPGMRRTDPDWHAAVVFNQILGASGFTSRLMKKIRSDEGLTYGVRTALGDGPHWKGDLSGSLQTNNKSAAFALRLAVAEMQKLKDVPVSAEELKVIKDGIIEAFPSQWANKQAVATTFANEALTGWPEDWNLDYREKIQAVTSADVQRMARKLLDLDKLQILVVGKASDMEAGDPDHPGALKDVARLPLVRLPLRDPLTLRPLAK